MTRLPATKVFYGLEFFLSMPTWVVMAVYLVRELHLSPLQLVLLGTAMEGSVFLFEVPTGVVADLYGRRLSQIIGYVGMGAAWMAVGLVSAPWLAIVLWAGWGLAYTFTSGAYEAWIADEVGTARVGALFLRGRRVGYGGAVLGLVLQVAVGTESLRAGVVVGGAITTLCGLACIFVMPETGFRPRHGSETRPRVRELGGGAMAGIRYARAAPIVGLLIAVALFTGMSSEAFDRLKEAHFLRDVGLPAVGHLSPVVWFGIFWLVGMVLGFLALGRLIPAVERGGVEAVTRFLLGFTFVQLAAMVLFALSRSSWPAIVGLLGVFFARDITGPLYTTWLNAKISDSSVRATVFSLSGQADAIGQAGGGPVLGLVGNVWGIPTALAAGATALVPAAALYARAIRRHGGEGDIALVPAGEA
jgi:DHA3 family tetracycline resistance protein-like MFS transporter